MSNLTMTPPRARDNQDTEDRGINGAVERLAAPLTGWLARHSVTILRVSLGLVFLGFGLLKFFPGASPAEALAVRTLDTLTFGILSGDTALLVTAAVETFIGLTLTTGKLLKTGLLVLGAALGGIMAPLVLFFGDLFGSGVTLEAQYIAKDIILVAAGLVITARALGARMITDQPKSDA